MSAPTEAETATPRMTDERLDDIEARIADPHFMTWTTRQEVIERDCAMKELLLEVKRLRAAPTPNEQTFETMDEAVKVAAQWDLGLSSPSAVEWLRRWVRLRMAAYTDGGWDRRDRESMVEWIAIDLALDDKDARCICDKAGWAA